MSKDKVESSTTIDISTDVEEDNYVKRHAVKKDAYYLSSSNESCLIITEV